MKDNYESIDSYDESSAEKKVGSKILSLANFSERHDIVESSFNKSRKMGEKMPVNNNNERRVYSYLSRLERIIEKHGNAAEKKLWQHSIKDDLLVDFEDIPDSYWEAKKQELRDNGYGDIEMDDYYKRELFNKEREIQKESLEEWANYLGDENSPYPLWFKVYAWDGMLKMGKYNKSKGKYEARNKTTVAPYPRVNPEVLGKVFEVVNRFYGNNEREFYTDEGERNIDFEKIVQSGNFAKIFNAVEHDIAPIIEPPESPEDVRGEWIEYTLGEEDDIARAASGTGWCVASPSVGKHYLEYGTYGDDYDDTYEDRETEAKFILLHLKDLDTGKLSKNAVASIRLGVNGRVEEISGLKEGQALNDSLVSTVEEKVKSLPGGEKFLEAFADKQELIRLDHKMKNGEELTEDELEFIYEINRKIKTLDTYNHRDPRIPELKRYGFEAALDSIGANKIASKLSPYEIAEELDTLIKHGADVNQIMTKLNPCRIYENLDTLIEHGAEIDMNHLVASLEPDEIAENLDTLIEHGAEIDMNQLINDISQHDILRNLDALIKHGAEINGLVARMNPLEVTYSLDTLIEHGAEIDMNQLVAKLEPDEIAENLDTLIEHGAEIDVNQLVAELLPFNIAENLDTLIEHGAEINELVDRMNNPELIVKDLDTLIEHGAEINVNQLVTELWPSAIAKNLDTLIEHGAEIDVNQLVAKLLPFNIAENLDTLIEHGAEIDVNQLVAKLNQVEIANNLDVLIKYSTDINRIVSWMWMDPENVACHLDTLIEHGAEIDMNHLVASLEPDEIAENLDTLIEHGAEIDMNQLINDISQHDILRNLDALIKHGAEINGLVARMNPLEVTYSLDTLIEHGAEIDMNQLVAKLEPDEIAENLDTLIEHGWRG